VSANLSGVLWQKSRHPTPPPTYHSKSATQAGLPE